MSFVRALKILTVLRYFRFATSTSDKAVYFACSCERERWPACAWALESNILSNLIVHIASRQECICPLSGQLNHSRIVGAAVIVVTKFERHPHTNDRSCGARCSDFGSSIIQVRVHVRFFRRRVSRKHIELRLSSTSLSARQVCGAVFISKALFDSTPPAAWVSGHQLVLKYNKCFYNSFL